MNLKYCTYIRFKGIFGWLYGWFLVGISEEKRTSGYVMEFAHYGVKVLLLEMQPPLKWRFRFIPKDAKVIGSGFISICRQVRPINLTRKRT